MATIDAFGGAVAAREVERAVRDLGLRGICVDCARGERFLDAPEARPVLDAAARLHVPIFVHPVSPAGYAEHLAQHDQPGVLMARGTETAASILSLVRSGVLAAMPDLTIVIPMMAASVLLFAGLIDQEEEHATGESGGRSDVLKRLYVDTMGFSPASVHFTVDTVGAEHVLVGSDWPILPIPARDRVERCLTDARFGPDERAAIYGRNAQRLLCA
jgi:predicted TIM-barrel fold metal-dependent hydrolase